MKNALTSWIATAVLCCILAVTAAQAQNTAQWAGWNAGKLGLTPDQKTKVEALQNDLDGRRQAVFANKALDAPARAAALLEINEDERAQVNKILTPAQKRKLKDLMYPRDRWEVTGYITTGAAPAHYVARLDGYPAQYMSYTIHRQDIRLRALDARGKPLANGPRLMLAADVPDVIEPVADWRGSSVCQVEFVLDRRTARPGLYVVEFAAAIDARDVETGKSVRLRDAVARLRVYVTPEPDQGPALRPGQRFLGTPWEDASATTATPYWDVKSGKPITWGEIAIRVATLQRVEPVAAGNRLTFVLEKHTGQICLETEHPATDLPYLTPLLTEPTVRNLKARYEGKLVWCYGGPGAQCVCTEPGMSISLSGRLDTPLRIRRIERVYRPGTEMAIGRATFLGGERESAFVTDNPLIVILEAPANALEFSAMWYVGGEDTSGAKDIAMEVASDPRAYCLGIWNELSDRWDFEREYSLSGPFGGHSRWPAKMRKAVLNSEVIKGMTREMVAWATGWPSMYGTKDEMLRIDDWAYDNIPFQGHIYFKNGRVVSQDWPSLP